LATTTAALAAKEQQQQQQQQQAPPSSPPPPPRHRVTIVGSGNFGSAVARLLGRNVLALPQLFCPDVRMWAFEETVSGHSLPPPKVTRLTKVNAI